MTTLSINDLLTPTLPVAAIKSVGNVRVDVGDITELAASIKETGLHQPIEVAIADDGAWLIDGHRRLAAVKKLKWKEVEVKVAADLDGMQPEEQRIAIQLVANMQRVDLSPLEEAGGYAQLKQFGWKQNQIARRLGRSEAHVSKRLALVELPPGALDLGAQGRLGPESLYALSRVQDAGGDVSRIVDDLLENNDPDEPISAEEVETMTTIALRNAAAAGNLSARKIEYEEKGVRVEIVEASDWDLPKLPKDRIGWDFDLDHDAHLTEKCALIVLYVRYGSIYESQHCTDRRRHQTGGASKLQLPDKKQSPESKAKAEGRRRNKALLAANEAAMEGRIPARDKIVERMTVLYLDRLEASAHDRAAKLLDVAAELKGEYKGLLKLYENADSTWRIKILLAAVLAHGHDKSAGSWGSIDEGHLAFLEEIGQTYVEDPA